MKVSIKKTGMFIALGIGVVASLSGYQYSKTHTWANGYLDSLKTEELKRLPENAVKGLTVAEGLEAQLFASEPVMTNPTNIDVDDRGRVWVCEAFNYRPAITGNETHTQGDRILILEDTNADGKADKHTVFYQGPELNAPLGIWVMGNKAIVSQSPYVWMFTDENGDDKADKKEIIFQGINGEQHDHGMHAFIFGPDGKYYFNFGNDGRQIKDGKGNPIIDKTGKEISAKNYKQGMVFRCDPDFTNYEVLGHNFRNNYEVAVDSYGTMWQSDNDDDGNKGVRINYVMEFGNYGYTDELTGAGWSVNRTNIEEEIPKRHWHLNDPGVVPNLLQTGAGSPTGMCIYEGSLLPQSFQNQMIHCDAGPNVVRAYPVQNNGAGYSATMLNILEGTKDQWFRPSDVCVAPDGSLIVSDWYDPGVGGHQAGDLNRGRVFRVAPPKSAYKIPTYDYSTTQGAIVALQNPNLSVRWKAWNALQNMGENAEKDLLSLMKTAQNPRMKARAFWILAKGKNGAKIVESTLQDSNPNLRMAALRAARQLNMDLVPILKTLVNDPDPQVRRECAIALRGHKSPEAPALWAELARRHDGKDRWYLEALGIGADGQWDTYFGAWLKIAGNEALTEAANRDIVWRARTETAVPLLARLATDESATLKERLRYFRAFDFNSGKVKSTALLEILKGNSQNQNEVNKLALRHLDADFVKTNTESKTALRSLMATLKGSEYLEFADRFGLEEENTRLFKMITQGEKTKEAGDILAKSASGVAMIKAAINNPKKETEAIAVLNALRWTGGRTQLDILKEAAVNKTRTVSLRKAAYEALGGSWGGEDMVLEMLKNNKIEKTFVPAAVQGVSRAWRRSVRVEASKYMGNAKASAGKKLPSIPELVAMKGDPAKGIQMYAQNCAVCHQVNGEGIDFGPKLSEIGSKLSKEGQYLAILHPDAGIGFGYEGFEIKLKDGSTMTGIVTSKTETDIILKMPGGTTQNLKTSNVVSIKQLPNSLMPTGLQENMSTQELVDLVEYLASLKKK
jgi:putative membrane-bound dehydrogenase-like protein